MSKGGSTKVVLFALSANLGIAISKFIGAAITQSSALLAEAIHSLVDTLNQVFLLIGSKKAAKPPTARHPLGYGRESFFWSFLVAVGLFLFGGVFAIYEGIHKFENTEPMSKPWVGVIILLISFLLEGFSFAACVKEVRKQNPYPSLWKWIQRATSVELLVIFLEDFAALLGLLIALVSLSLSWATENPIYDSLGSIVVGVVLVAVSAILTYEIKSLIIGEAASDDYDSFLKQKVREFFPAGHLLHSIAMQVGSDEVMVSFKFFPNLNASSDQLIHQINTMEKSIRAEKPQVRWLFVEPDFEK